jgi:hypothetical protein
MTRRVLEERKRSKLSNNTNSTNSTYTSKTSKTNSSCGGIGARNRGDSYLKNSHWSREERRQARREERRRLRKEGSKGKKERGKKESRSGLGGGSGLQHSSTLLCTMCRQNINRDVVTKCDNLECTINYFLFYDVLVLFL